MRHCTVCGETGHNKQTCPSLPENAAKQQTVPKVSPKPSAVAPKGPVKNLKLPKIPTGIPETMPVTKKELRALVVQLQGLLRQKQGKPIQTPTANPKAQTPKAGTTEGEGTEGAEIRKCSFCGETGHNARTCPTTYRCSVCGKKGHNARTCETVSAG